MKKLNSEQKWIICNNISMAYQRGEGTYEFLCEQFHMHRSAFNRYVLVLFLIVLLIINNYLLLNNLIIININNKNNNNN